MGDHRKERSSTQQGMETSTNLVDLYKSLGPSGLKGYEHRATADTSRPTICRRSAINFAISLSRMMVNFFFSATGAGWDLELPWPFLGGLQHGCSTLRTLSLHAELRAVNAYTPGMSKMVVAGSACVATNMVKAERQAASKKATTTPLKAKTGKYKVIKEFKWHTRTHSIIYCIRQTDTVCTEIQV